MPNELEGVTEAKNDKWNRNRNRNKKRNKRVASGGVKRMSGNVKREG